MSRPGTMLHLGSSALVKLVVAEVESVALLAFLDDSLTHGATPAHRGIHQGPPGASG